MRPLCVALRRNHLLDHILPELDPNPVRDSEHHSQLEMWSRACRSYTFLDLPFE